MGDTGGDSVLEVERKLVQQKFNWGSSRPALGRTIKGTFTNMFIANGESEIAGVKEQ